MEGQLKGSGRTRTGSGRAAEGQWKGSGKGKDRQRKGGGATAVTSNSTAMLSPAYTAFLAMSLSWMERHEMRGERGERGERKERGREKIEGFLVRMGISEISGWHTIPSIATA